MPAAEGFPKIGDFKVLNEGQGQFWENWEALVIQPQTVLVGWERWEP